MMKLKKAVIPVAIATTLGLGVAGNAQAGAYGYSFNDIFGLTTTFNCTTTAANCLGTAGVFSLNSYQSSSQADANLSLIAGGIADGEVDSGPPFPVDNVDAPVQYQGFGVAPADNAFAAIGQVSDYARGDAQIVSQQINNTGPSRSINVAEGNLGLHTVGQATANGTNSSNTGFTLVFTVAETWNVAFDFDALPFMESLITKVGATSTADLDVSFTINDVTIPTAPVLKFNWAPNGVVGDGITGGTETADDASLNLEISDVIVDATSIIYDPLNGVGTAACSGGVCDYSASSDQFGAGTYSMILTMHEGIVLTNNVPEPTALAFMGLGLVGMGFARRSRKA